LKKQASNTTNTVTVTDELDSIFNFDKEEACYKNQWIDEASKVAYKRAKTPEQIVWDLFREKCIDPKTGKWFTSGEGTGTPKGKIGPKRYVTSIIRMKASSGVEYLLSQSKIIGYNQSGDPVETNASLPEKYQKTTFRYETTPNYKTGFAERRNTGPSSSNTIYTLKFSPENAKKLFDMRENDYIEFVVKNESQGKVYGVKPQIKITDTFKLFSENNFDYLYNGNYISYQDKLLAMKRAEGEGLIPPQSDDDRAASILAQEALSQKDKMASYG
jgi:hypothetical protein